MSTLDSDNLMKFLENFSVSRESVNFAEADILTNPLDICRSSLAELLSSLAECDVQDAYKSIQWPNNIFNGDLSVTIPRLRSGCKPAELSAVIVNQVRMYIRN
jgi:arginyl-tRNA synthetase